MSQTVFKWFLFILGTLAFLAGAAVFFYFNHTETDNIKDAYILYSEGEKATSPKERQEAFNKALQLYTEMEKGFSPKYGSGVLYYNIANSYYQLGEYPMALLYFSRAERLRPNDSRVLANKKMTIEKLDITPPKPLTWMNPFLLFHRSISLPHRLQMFALLTLLLTALWSILIWKPRRWIKGVTAVFVAVYLFLGLNLLYAALLSPVDAIVIKGSLLYRDAGTQYAAAQKLPLPAGSEVTLLDLKEKGTWMKVITQEGQIGYIPSDRARVI